MKIAIKVYGKSSINTNNDGQNVQGDEMIALAWMKYLKQIYGVESSLFDRHDSPSDEFDAVIHFDLITSSRWPKIKNICYLQNAFPAHHWSGGTIGQFNQHKHKFDEFIFTSDTLRNNCSTDGAIVQFAVDHEIYQHINHREIGPKTYFVGNGIRTYDENIRYLGPAVKHGLSIYGNGIGWPEEFASNLKGKISIKDEICLYQSTGLCMNHHMEEHVINDTINFRIYCALACGATIISDKVKSLTGPFLDGVLLTDGYDNTDELIRTHNSYQNNNAIDYILTNHTFINRAQIIHDFLRSVI